MLDDDDWVAPVDEDAGGDASAEAADEVVPEDCGLEEEENDDKPRETPPVAEEVVEEEAQESRGVKRSAVDRTLKLAGLEFEDREALWRHCQEVQQRLDRGNASETFAQNADAFFLCLLLSQHPSAHEKMAPGVSALGYGVNQEYPDTKSFFVVRVDGSRAGFSARKCVDALYPAAPDAPPLLLAPFSKRYKAESDKYGPSRQPAALRSNFEPGSIVAVAGLEGQAVSYAEIKECLNRFAPVKYVDVDDDLGTATVRFDSAASAQRAIAECADINGCRATLVLATPEEEDKLRKDFEHRDARPHHRPANAGRGRPMGRGGGHYRGRGGGRSRGRPLGRGIRGRSLSVR